MAGPMKLAKPWVAEWLDLLPWTERIMWYSVKYPHGCDYSFYPIWSCFCWSWFLLLPILLFKTLVSLLVELVFPPHFPINPPVLVEQPSHPQQVASGYAGSGVYGGSPVYTGAQYQYQPAPMTYATGPWGYGGYGWGGLGIMCESWGKARLMGGAPQLMWV